MPLSRAPRFTYVLIQPKKNEMLGTLAPLGIKPGKFRSPDKLIAMLASG